MSVKHDYVYVFAVALYYYYYLWFGFSSTKYTDAAGAAQKTTFGKLYCAITEEIVRTFPGSDEQRMGPTQPDSQTRDNGREDRQPPPRNPNYHCLSAK